MDYIGILKKAYRISIKNKFLWIFGILAGGYGGFQGFGGSFNSFNSGSADREQFDKFFNSFDFNVFWGNYGGLIITLIGLFVLIGIIFAILGIISQGALISSVGKIDAGEKADFKTGWKIGWHQFWRVFALSLIYGLVVFISLTILIVPTVIFTVTHLVVLAVIWGILVFLVCLFLWIVIGIISPYSLRILVIEKTRIIESIRESLRLLRHNLGHIIIMYLLLMGVGIVVGIGLVIAIFFILLVLVLIGLGLWLINPIPTYIFAGLAGICFVVLMMVFSGFYNTFTSSVITLTYRNLVKDR